MWYHGSALSWAYFPIHTGQRKGGAMTLVVSVRVPDGIVIAADSLATLSATAQVSAKAQVTCPECGHTHETDVRVPVPMNMGIVSTFPNAQKVLPLFASYGVGTFGTSLIAGRTVFSIVREFEKEKYSECQGWPLLDIAKSLGDWLQNLLAAEGDISKIPESSHALGFQIVGYENGKASTVPVTVGSVVKAETYNAPGVTVNGETAVVTNLWQLKGADPRMGQFYTGWSVQDAIEYVKFLISTTSALQR